MRATTSPVGMLESHRASWWRRLRNRTRGVEPPSPEYVTPGLHQFTAEGHSHSPSRAAASAVFFHDTALDQGFESELITGFPDGASEVRVRQRGSTEILFVTDGSA